MKAQAIGIIPARLASSRFPRKILADRTGRPLVCHAHEAASRAATLSRVVVAADDPAILDACRAHGVEAMLTRADHANGTSRLAEAAAALRLPPDSLVANIQGDEPEIEPGAIDAAVELARRMPVEVATVASAFAPGEDPADPNIVKVVTRADSTALYFSRSLVPYPRFPGTPPMRHVGLYVYRVSFLARYCTLAPTPLEQAESLEQLRVLEHGFRIGVARFDCRAAGIDTPEQYEAFVTRWRARHA